eukprot:6414020-Pyramimonas_sp.AAC.1
MVDVIGIVVDVIGLPAYLVLLLQERERVCVADVVQLRLLLLAELRLEKQPNLHRRRVTAWLRRGQIHPAQSNVQEALLSLGPRQKHWTEDGGQRWCTTRSCERARRRHPTSVVAVGRDEVPN